MCLILSSCSGNNFDQPLESKNINEVNDVFAFATEKPKLPIVNKVKKSIIMGYWALDSNIDPAADTHLPNLEEVGSNENLNIILLLDRKDKNTRTYFIDKKDSTYVNLKEKNMSDSKELESFVNSSLKNYPAFIKILDIASHGFGYKGFIVDMDPVKNSIMPIDKFATSLRKALNGKKLDLINILACLMSNIEFMNEIKDLSNYAVASQDVTYGGEILAYKNAYSKLSQGDDNVEKIVKKIVETASKIKNATTMAGIDLSKINQVTLSINKLSLVLIDKLSDKNIASKILNAYNQTPAPFGSTLDKLPSRDIISFCNNLLLINDSDIKNLANNLKKDLKSSFIIEKSAEGKNANGMSIYMPLLDVHQEIDVNYTNLKFAKETNWLNFINKLSKLPNENKYVTRLMSFIDKNKDSNLSKDEMRAYFGYETGINNYEKLVYDTIIFRTQDFRSGFISITSNLSVKEIPIKTYLNMKEADLKAIDITLDDNKPSYDFHKKKLDWLTKNSLNFDKNRNSTFDMNEFIDLNLECYLFGGE